MSGITPEVIRALATNLYVYGKMCLHIRTKSAKVVPLTFNKAQTIVHEMLAEQYATYGYVRAVILKARQEGISTYVAARFFRRIHLFPNQEALVIAHEKDPGQAIYGIYDRYYNYLPNEIKPMVRYLTKKTEMVLDNKNDAERRHSPGLGCRISVETANDTNAGRGSTIQMVHASELAFWEKPEDVWGSLTQAVPDMDSEIIVESTANGVGNFFHQMWQAAEEGTNQFLAIFLPWWIHEEYVIANLDPRDREDIIHSLDPYEQMAQGEGFDFMGEKYKLTPEQLAWRRRTIAQKLQGDDRAFRQEYPSNAEEAFLTSGAGFFDDDVMERYSHSTMPYIRRGTMVKMGNGIVLKPQERGFVRIWDQPRREGLYVIGADTASGRQVSARQSSFSDPNSEKGGRDFSCADVYDVVSKRQVAQLHGRMAPEVFAEQLRLLGLYYSTPVSERSSFREPALIAVEKNHSSGETVLRLLQQDYRYPRLFFSRRLNRRSGERREEFLGWRTTVETRMPMLDELNQHMREDAIGIPNKDTLKEMRTFVRGEDGKPEAQEGAHDDRVIALAIALQAARTVSVAKPPMKKVSGDDFGNSPTGLFNY